MCHFDERGNEDGDQHQPVVQGQQRQDCSISTSKTTLVQEISNTEDRYKKQSKEDSTLNATLASKSQLEISEEHRCLL